MSKNKGEKEKEKEKVTPPETEDTNSDTGPETPEIPEDPADTFTKEKEALIAELDTLKDQLLRQMAEFDNFRKRTEREKSDIYTRVTANCAKEMLAVLDNFERAAAAESTDAGYKEGISMILKQFNEVLANLGVTEIEALHQPFNPDLHEAVSQVQDDAFDENIVCQVFRKGYKIGDRIIRPATVVVANP